MRVASENVALLRETIFGTRCSMESLTEALDRTKRMEFVLLGQENTGVLARVRA